MPDVRCTPRIRVVVLPKLYRFTNRSCFLFPFSLRFYLILFDEESGFPDEAPIIHSSAPIER